MCSCAKHVLNLEPWTSRCHGWRGRTYAGAVSDFQERGSTHAADEMYNWSKYGVRAKSARRQNSRAGRTHMHALRGSRVDRTRVRAAAAARARSVAWRHGGARGDDDDDDARHGVPARRGARSPERHVMRAGPEGTRRRSIDHSRYIPFPCICGEASSWSGWCETGESPHPAPSCICMHANPSFQRWDPRPCIYVYIVLVRCCLRKTGNNGIRSDAYYSYRDVYY